MRPARYFFVIQLSNSRLASAGRGFSSAVSFQLIHSLITHIHFSAHSVSTLKKD